ncbi:MAG TPA: response regulator, partial [Polyangiaceae bacterium]
PPRPVVDAQTEASAADLDITTREFGSVGADDSAVTSLPVELQARISAAANAVSGPATGKLVLVVDDEDEIRKLLRRLLTEKGYRVVEADRGLLALRMVKEQVPDLIILDAMLPEIHGFDIARRIKGSEKYGSIPIVMISAVYRGWRIAEDLKNSHGIEEYLEKPFRIADVLAAVQRALASRQASDKAPEAERDAMSGEAEKALERGIAAYKEGNIDEAIVLLVRGVAIDPLAFRLRFHLGLLYGKKGLLYEGIQELEKSVEINPKSFPALKNLAVLYEKAGFRHKAVEMWERCVQAAPDADTRTQIKQHLVGLL